MGGSLVKTFVVRVYCRFNGCIGRRESIGDHDALGEVNDESGAVVVINR
jgi:hypothetical protein